MRVRDPELPRVDVAEDGPNERRRVARRAPQLQARAVRAQSIAQLARSDVARLVPGVHRQRRRSPGRLAHRHALGHLANRCVRIVGGTETPTCDQDIRRIANK